MHKIKKPITIAINNIRKWQSNPRLYILASLLIIFVLYYIGPIINFSKVMGYRVTPWLFPFISDSVYAQMMMLLGITFLFCDAPFMDITQQYIFIRCGRLQWGIGQIIYIILGTIIYFLFIVIVVFLTIMPSMFLDLGWGKILGTLALTNAGQMFQITLPISYQIQVLYSPIQALCLSLLLECCAGIIIGLIVFIMNLYCNKAIGVIAASVIICLDMVIKNALPYYMYRFSPASMAHLSILDSSSLSQRPSVLYSLIFYTVIISILSFISIFLVQRRQTHISLLT